MAVICNVTDGTTTIDFNTATGFQLLDEYVPKAVTPPGDGSIPPYITEVLPCRIVAASDDALATALQNFALLQKQAAEYWRDKQQPTPVWFHMKLYDELGERRAFVKSLSLDPNENWFLSCTTGTDGYWIPVNVIIERHPYWERTTAVEADAAAPAAAASVTYDYTNVADVVGDVGARIERLRLRATVAAIDRLWVGIRSVNRHGTVTNFIPVWECEDGSNNVAESGITDQPDVTASGGDMVRLVETDLNWDDEWHRVFSLSMNAAGGAGIESDQFGNFLWLLRTYVDAATTWEIEARFGYGTATATARGKIEVSNTSWDFKEIGIAAIPLRNLQIHPLATWADGYETNFQVQIYAQRTAGAGNLYCDCICPIPIDEGFLYIEGAYLLTGGADQSAEVARSPKDELDVRCQNTVTFYRSPSFSPSRFYLPPGDGRMFISYARADSSVLTDSLWINLGDTGTFYPRWTSLRGTE